MFRSSIRCSRPRSRSRTPARQGARRKSRNRSSAEFWHNFRHNLFKPLLLFFYLGFLVPILRVHFEFPYVMYQALTIYLLIAIGWHGGEELAHLNPDTSRPSSGSCSWGS